MYRAENPYSDIGTPASLTTAAVLGERALAGIGGVLPEIESHTPGWDIPASDLLALLQIDFMPQKPIVGSLPGS